MTRRSRRPAPTRAPSRARERLETLAAPPRWSAWLELQRAWWVVGVAGGLVATLGFQTLPPSRRLAAIEAVNVRQDSAFAHEVVQQRVALDTIRRQLGQLLAGQCAKERDGMARVLYGCGGGR